MKKTILAAGACLLLSLATACSTLTPGDGKVAGISLDPAVASAADFLDAKAPGLGLGDRLRAYHARTKLARVPEGYRIVWLVEDTTTKEVVPLAVWREREAARAKLFRHFPQIEPTTTADTATPPDAIADDVTLADIKSALSAEDLAALLKLLGK